MNNFIISNIIYDKTFREPTTEEKQDIILLIDMLMPHVDRSKAIQYHGSIKKKANYECFHIQKMMIKLGFYYPLTWINEVKLNKKKMFKPVTGVDSVEKAWLDYFKKMKT